MVYAGLTFWLFLIVLTALGVHRLWSGLIQPKMVNAILLPGTLVATLGHILGLLITGNTVENTTLIRDDESGEPQTGEPGKNRIPIVGAVLIALLPMIGCAAVIYAAARYIGSPILQAMAAQAGEPPALPTSWPLFFDLMHRLIGLVERLIGVVVSSDLNNWRTLLFLYLAICLTVRMAPLTGNLRGALGAIVLTGLLAFVAGQISDAARNPLADTWPLIAFSVAVLLLLLMASLLITGAVSLFRAIAGKG